MELGRLVWAATCYADDVVLLLRWLLLRMMMAEVIAKLKEVGLTVGAQNTLDEPPEDDGHKHLELAVLSEEVLEFVGSKVCLDGNASQDTRLHTGEMERE